MGPERIAACLIFLFVAPHLAHAADADNRAATRERELGRRVQLLQQENRELSGKVKKLEDEAAESITGLEKARASASAAARRGLALEKELAEVKADAAAKAESLARESSQVRELQQQLAAASARIERGEGEKRELQGMLERQRQALTRQGQLILACRGENEKLDAWAADVLNRLRDAQHTGPDAPLGFGAVRSYNEFDALRARYDALKREAPAGP